MSLSFKNGWDGDTGRIRQGQGKPDRIYVMRFTMQELPPQTEKEPKHPAPPQEVDFDDAQASNTSI